MKAFRLLLGILSAAILHVSIGYAQVGPIPGIGPMLSYGHQTNLTYVGSNNSTSTATTITFTSQSIGTASSDRIVLVCLNWIRGATGGSTTSVTVGGSAATLVSDASSTNLGGFSFVTSIYQIAVSTGTTATISASFSSAGSGATIDVYTLTNYRSATAAYASNTNNASATTLSLTPSVNSGAVILATSQYAAIGAYTWSGVTKDSDQAVASLEFSSASVKNIKQGSRTVQATIAGAAKQMTLAVAAWY